MVGLDIRARQQVGLLLNYVGRRTACPSFSLPVFPKGAQAPSTGRFERLTTKAPGFAGGYLLFRALLLRQQLLFCFLWPYGCRSDLSCVWFSGENVTDLMTLNTAHGQSRLPWWVIVLGLVIAYSPMFLNRLAQLFGARWAWLGGPQSILVWNWAVAVVLIAFVLLVERRRLASIGFRRPGVVDILLAIGFWIISVLASAFVHSLLPPSPSGGLEIMLAFSIPVLVLIVVTASITEEIFYRGYAIERLAELTGSLWLAVTISFVLFLLPHIAFFGPTWLLYQGVSVVLLYVLYVWRRNLWACMLTHLLGNLMILFPALGLAE